MEEPKDPYAEWNRPIPGQPPELIASYADEEFRDNALRAHTARAHEDEVSLWLASLSLLATAFEQGRVYHSGTPAPGSEEDSEEATSIRGAFALRLQLLGLMGRAAKPALDLTLSAYYTEAWTLLRTMLDGWARCIYVRLRHQEHVRWYAPQEGAPFKGDPDWGKIGGVIASRGSAEDKELFAVAELRWELLHMGVHPSGEGIEQVRNDALNLMMYRPEYHHGFCMHTFSVGAFVLRALLREVELLGSHEEWWLRTNAKHASNVESLENSIPEALEEMAKRIAAKRAAKKAQRAAERRRRQANQHLNT
jgi:hypothetical protein